MYVLLLCVLVIVGSEATCPNIISRSSWGARSVSRTSSLRVNPPTHVVIHHSASGGCTTESSCSRLVRSFQNYHIDNNKWDDIGYNFLIGGDGNVYEGRGWGKAGAHAPNYNSKSIGICFIGTFNDQVPNNAALEAAQNLIECGVSSGKISSNYLLVGHRQVRQTQCPGNSLFEEIKTWPNWTQRP